MHISWSDFALRDLKQFDVFEAQALRVQLEEVLQTYPCNEGESIRIRYDDEYVVICHRFASPKTTSILRILYEPVDTL
ncbi:hypothetical protein [Sulfobacillus thermosulfidooxidans]|uniref:hypothetical protein n=1 Tax=Sulfobacillus thermosulfidooxidans TaxID=28034 RepID=UPI00096BCE65|nr:hypothetical protein [Sulfobacillus thermosulfidooxidans]OLZ10362.1 hypothetical protein BFX05_10245 [Sulfobacillus thermosulfidooxidans]OLZ15270.1 hypothetical protein BFX06_04870 [Sulfobacillus thermosulfidooxidans]OLZ21109.1 hypothetical protein BFX07_13935 [Sulfobacillus thermosulfidooxidans]